MSLAPRLFELAVAMMMMMMLLLRDALKGRWWNQYWPILMLLSFQQDLW